QSRSRGMGATRDTGIGRRVRRGAFAHTKLDALIVPLLRAAGVTVASARAAVENATRARSLHADAPRRAPSSGPAKIALAPRAPRSASLLPFRAPRSIVASSADA